MIDRKIGWVYSTNTHPGYFRSLDLSGFTNDPEGKRKCLIENGVIEDRETPRVILRKLGFVEVGEVEVEGHLAFPGGQFASTSECIFFIPNFPEWDRNLIASKSKETFQLLVDGISAECDLVGYIPEFTQKRMSTSPREKVFKVNGFTDITDGSHLSAFSFVLAKQQIAVYKDGIEWETIVSVDRNQTPISIAVL